jgi:transposase
MFLPARIDEYVAEDDPVRAYDAFVDTLDWRTLGLVADEHQAGCPAYHPNTMLKILAYGYSYGIRSSRKLERALHHNLAFIWIAGGLKPDFKTISRFRRDHRAALKKVIKRCAQLCVKLDLIAGNVLFVDGSKFRANAGIAHTCTAEQCDQRLQQIDQRIDELLTECERVDTQEAQEASSVHLKEELADQRRLKQRVEAAVEQLQAQGLTQINTTDPDSTVMRSRQGCHAAANAQIVADDQHGLIVNSDVVKDNNDRRQFAEQIQAAQAVTGKTAQVAGADSGYYSGKELEAMATVATTVLVPVRGQVHPSKDRPFAKAHFTYRADEDVYVCPAGHRLRYRRTDEKRRWREYQLEGSTCCACEHYKACTRGRNGRKIVRYVNEALRDQFRRQFETPTNQAVYKRRQQTVELTFGHFKRNLGAGQFLLRGLAGMRAELSLLASVFNVSRLISLLGVRGLIAKLSAL